MGGFEGNVSVSTVKQVYKGLELGRDDIIKSAIVDDAEPVVEEAGLPVRSNSSVLYGMFPEEAAVKGVVHDAAVNLLDHETEFQLLDLEPSDSEIIELLEGSVEGRRPASTELQHRISNLERNYGITPGNMLDHSFESGRTVRDMLQEVAEYRGDFWSQEADSFRNVNTESPIFADGVSGRIDAEIETGEGREIRELKMGEDRKYDKFQVSAYWLMNGDEDASAILEYPVEDKRLRFDPDGQGNDFNPREYAFDVYRTRDTAKSLIRELRELQEEEFGRADSREKATRKALRRLEVN